MESFVEMRFRRKGGKPYRYSVIDLMTGYPVGSQMVVGSPPVVIVPSAGGADYHDIMDLLEWGGAGYQIFAVYRWEAQDFRLDQEVIGFAVYCVAMADAVGLRLRWSTSCHSKFDTVTSWV